MRNPLKLLALHRRRRRERAILNVLLGRDTLTAASIAHAVRRPVQAIRVDLLSLEAADRIRVWPTCGGGRTYSRVASKEGGS